MTGILLCLAALALLSGALWLLLCHESLVARWYYRIFPSQAVYPPEVAEVPDPVDAVHDEYQRSSYFVDGGHPADCAEKCCWEIRLTEMHDAFDWGAYEHEMRSKS